ncbi:MAG TPA: hypothetical protein H9884_04610 [Candidatus Yaniella excrementigallinarum]|nr:hypothetical protein [Candidatus Yaniella excrementigallinarum]
MLMARRKIDVTAGIAAVRQWAADPQSAPRAVRARAVRYSLEELANLAPGRSVEVRVPPFGVTQILEGTTHTRGTPGAVVETDAATWLALVVGQLDWAVAVDSGNVVASGQRTDLSELLPLVKL